MVNNLFKKYSLIIIYYNNTGLVVQKTFQKNRTENPNEGCKTVSYYHNNFNLYALDLFNFHILNINRENIRSIKIQFSRCHDKYM